MEFNRQINCEDCTKRNPAPVSYLVHESIVAMMERTIKRLWIMCIVLILVLVGTNVAWIAYENSFTDEISTTVEAHSDTGSAIANNTGEVTINGIGEGYGN